MTNEGTEWFGTPPPDAECDEELGYGPEVLEPDYVFAVRTDFCDYLTVTQPTLRAIEQGDTIYLRWFHATLTAAGGGEGYSGVVIGDEVVWEDTFLIPPSPGTLPLELIIEEWEAPKDFPEGTPILFNVHNHGGNEYAIIELNLLP